MLKAGDLVTAARGELLRRLADAKEQVLLTSPFLSAPVAEHVVEALENSPARDRRLITAFTSQSVRTGVLDPKALMILRGAGFEVATILNLHAKVAAIDRSWGLVGSGNLTNAGLGDAGVRMNLEMGVVLNDAQVNAAAAIVSDWWLSALAVSDAAIAAADEIERISWPPDAAIDAGLVVEPVQTDRLRQILSEDSSAAASRRYWLKSAYHSPADPDWWHRNWISDALLPSYEVGDLIVVYLGRKNGGPKRCPAVLRAESAPREDPQWVLDHGDKEAAVKWRYVTETSFVADVPLSDGAPLSAIGKTGRSLRRGNCSISRTQFEALAEAMLS